MARKDFHFDFDEEADPVDELHRLRVAATKHFKTMKEHVEYLRATPTAEEFLARLDAEDRAARVKPAKSAKRPGPRKRRQLANA